MLLKDSLDKHEESQFLHVRFLRKHIHLKIQHFADDAFVAALVSRGPANDCTVGSPSLQALPPGCCSASCYGVILTVDEG